MKRMAYVEVIEGSRLHCFCPPDVLVDEGDRCIIKADRVIDSGVVVRIKENKEESPPEGGFPKVLRRATEQDLAGIRKNALMDKTAMETCTARAEKYGLKIRLVRVRHSFDRAVLTVLFNAEERVDFREMVKELAGELHTRVEMKLIGVRDEAGLIGGLGPCGRRLCCSTWLHHFNPVNVKMAKTQRISLNPGAIGGMCGRLKCCLRYEYEQYRELDRCLPHDGACVRCPEGTGYVVGKNILAGRVKVRMDDDERLLEYAADQVENVWQGKGKDGR